ncbi:tRNA-uridine aminocarboxypropyltransferase [Undibacterium oligocarboniphilum]|uniref:tRNA-uridine aminocarboxypropyltransferase n=1 Tax=Undibacterium oligocarboniphilum TaxID=666702 RepID=A0A850QCK3_9BURK|nr:tRNA-uridine aminocarboxypropyltransferase [Undibacterium oligocarboniphilum]MBC3869698.1 DTW domain-containing protein [Undibacterium oligocarboniphilum]NVO77301.1 DTW domain-containing protein [Undibacterium oligocarboniphilum]
MNQHDTARASDAGPAYHRRLVCERCDRAQAACICACIQRVANQTDVLILQHPLEVHHAKGSVRLLHLCLDHSRIICGEQFAPDLLEQALYGANSSDHPHHQQHCPSQRQPVLLYPDTSQNQAPDLMPWDAAARPLPAELTGIRLVVLDATWRKSRKMLYLNPALQCLPRISLEHMPASHYRIRRAHQPDQLSSLEACAYALMRIEQNEQKFRPLLQAFDAFINQQMQRIPDLSMNSEQQTPHGDGAQ